MTKFYDTNAILELQESIFDSFFMCSYKTLTELENIKTNRFKDDSIKEAARHISKLLNKNSDNFKISVPSYSKIEELLKKYGMEINDDNIIIACAYIENRNVNDIEFITNDISCKNIAKNIFGLSCNSTDLESIYKGYEMIDGDSDYINNTMNNMDTALLNINEYLIIHNTEDDSYKEMRFDGKSFVTLKLPPSKIIKGKNSLQRCALDMLSNNDIGICVVLGNYGSGKTFLSLRTALYEVKEKGHQSKILGVREPIGQGKSVGFLSGNFEDKTEQFFLPLAQQLEGGTFELDSLKQQNIIESNIPYYLKGSTYANTIIICDEAEDLDEKQIRLIGTRLGEGSRIFFSGDYKQSLINSTQSNGIIKMCDLLKGNPNFACIYMDEDVRSETSKMFANLFK
jgi:predicted ribonuclease YlaK